jgi:thiosulfate sulfurtransferase
MSDIGHLSVADASVLLAQGKADVVDIRDPASYAAGHIAGAQHLDNSNLARYLERADRQRPLIVCCYHGNSSIPAAQYLLQQGFSTVYSLDGGIEAWRFNHALVAGDA